MKFEVGKFYKHTTGHCLAILCEQETTMYGKTLLAEHTCEGDGFIAVGMDEARAINYHEISREEWLLNFQIEGEKP